MRRLWLACALALAAMSVQAPSSSAAAGCGTGAGYDLFRTGAGTYYNPIADALSATSLSLPLTNISFKGVPLGAYDFANVGVRPTASTDTIVQRLGTVGPAGGSIPIELVALQLQANGIAGIAADLPVYVTLQSRRGSGLLDPPAGARSLGVLQVTVDPDCLGGTVHADFTVNFDVRVLGIDGPILLSRALTLTTNARWTANPPTEEVENCHPHTIQTGVHCTLGPPTLIDRVNANVQGGDFYLGPQLP